MVPRPELQAVARATRRNRTLLKEVSLPSCFPARNMIAELIYSQYEVSPASLFRNMYCGTEISALILFEVSPASYINDAAVPSSSRVWKAPVFMTGLRAHSNYALFLAFSSASLSTSSTSSPSLIRH